MLEKGKMLEIVAEMLNTWKFYNLLSGNQNIKL